MGGDREARGRRRQAALAIAALLLLNAPLLVVVDRLALPGASGAPLTPLYVFAAWLGVIGLCALNSRRPPPPPPRA